MTPAALLVPLLSGALILGAGAVAAAPDAQRPGTVIHVTADDLPPPGASDSVANPPRIVPRPTGVAPQVPEGYTATLFAAGLDHARWLVMGPAGGPGADDVFLAESSAGRVTALRDSTGDGTADQRAVFAEGLNRPHGLAFHGDGLYVADIDAVWRFPYRPGSLEAAGPPVQVTPPGALGDGAGHWTRNVAISPDGTTLFVAIGSRGNIAEEAPPRATVQAFDLTDNGRRAVNQRTFASGLRNPVGLVFHPHTGALWTVVNERDGLGDELPPDYMAEVAAGSFHGWPYAYTGPNPQPGLADRAPDLVAATRPPDVLFRAHSAALGLAFDADSGDAFVGLRGSWNAAAPRGYAVARVPFDADGRPTGAYELFATGFWQAGAQRAEVWGRPVGVAVTPQGAVLVAVDVAQEVWKISPAR